MGFCVIGLSAESVSEFTDSIMQSVLKGLYDALYGELEKTFNGLFNSLNDRIATAGEELTKSPAVWNVAAYSTVRNVAENVCIPIAGSIIIFIFCWEMIHIVQDSNRMQNVRPENIIMQLLKFFICLLACSKSWDIVMGLYDIGAWATGKLSSSTVGTFGEGLRLEDIIPPVTDRYTLSMILNMLSNYIVLWIGRLVVMVCSAIIYVRVILWFMELLIYASAAPIPFATFGNREWSQIGMNYVRKMLAISFEGFFMLLTFAIYGGVVSGIGEGDFTQTMIMIIGCGVALIYMLFKSKTIATSIFNAH